MFVALVILAIIACVFLILVVLVQNPKGGGLSSNFSSSSQLMGVQKTGDFLEKGTWVLAITLMVLALAVNVVSKGGSNKVDSQYQEQIQKSLKTAPATPSTTPATQPLQAPVKP